MYIYQLCQPPSKQPSALANCNCPQPRGCASPAISIDLCTTHPESRTSHCVACAACTDHGPDDSPRGGRDLYRQNLEPFVNPFTGQPFMPEVNVCIYVCIYRYIPARGFPFCMQSARPSHPAPATLPQPSACCLHTLSGPAYTSAWPYRTCRTPWIPPTTHDIPPHHT